MVSFRELLEVFWSAHSPTSRPWSTQYRAAVFTVDEEQQSVARASKSAVGAERGEPVMTALESGARFWAAEDYHQKYKIKRRSELYAELLTLFADDEALLRSRLAARVNGVLGGHGSRQMVREELERLEVPEPKLDEILRLLAR